MLADKLEEGTPKKKPSGKKLISRFAGSEPTIQQNLYKLEPEEFDLIEDSANRMGTGVTYTHLKKLKDQMVDDGGFSPDWPITVDQNGLISDGHTRFRAAKELQVFLSFICTRTDVSEYLEEFNRQSKTSTIYIENNKAIIQLKNDKNLT